MILTKFFGKKAVGHSMIAPVPLLAPAPNLPPQTCRPANLTISNPCWMC